MVEGKNGVTAKTPGNIPFGPGTIHKGLKYANNAWNFKESLVGATSGGSKVSIVPEIYRPEIDGVYVNVKGLAKKLGEKATMEVNFCEVTEDIVQAATFAEAGESEDTNYEVYTSKSDIEEGDYWENIAYVGTRLDTGKKCIFIMDNALCTSGFEQESKNKEITIGKYTFECSASLEQDEFDKLPWRFYYPKATA